MWIARRAGSVVLLFAAALAGAGQFSELRAVEGGAALTPKLATYAWGFESEPLRTAHRYTAVGAHWLADIPPGTGLAIHLRTSADGHSWSDYVRVAADPHLVPPRRLPDGRANPNFGETLGQLFFRKHSDGHYVQYKVVFTYAPGVGDRARLSRLAFSVIDARAARRGPPAASERPVDLSYPKPFVFAREEWDALPPNCTYAYCPTTHIAVHHSAGVGDYFCSGFAECAPMVRAIQSFHMNTNGWCDVGYNYLATSDGALWEGRGGGDDVRGAHDGFNCGSMGVANLGYFHPPFNHLWTEAQENAVASLAAWKSDAQGIDPFGVGFYAGLGGMMDNLYGHRDVSATACPGDNIHARLPALRSQVDDKLVNGPREWIFDNNTVEITAGAWTAGTASGDKFGADYLWTSTGGGLCAWRIDVQTPGLYEIALWWPAGANRNPNTRVVVKRAQPTPALTVDQQTGGGQWNRVTTLLLARGEVQIGVSGIGEPGFVVMCDALRLRPLH